MQVTNGLDINHPVTGLTEETNIRPLIHVGRPHQEGPVAHTPALGHIGVSNRRPQIGDSLTHTPLAHPQITQANSLINNPIKGKHIKYLTKTVGQFLSQHHSLILPSHTLTTGCRDGDHVNPSTVPVGDFLGDTSHDSTVNPARDQDSERVDTIILAVVAKCCRLSLNIGSRGERTLPPVLL